jgi:hypothetical protein
VPKEHLAQVPSWYGPGAVICWLLMYASVLVIWTVNKNIRSIDRITNDLATALTFPAVAAGHLVYLIAAYPGNRSEILVTTDEHLSPRVAAIEAALCICDDFCVLALILCGICMLGSHYKRFSCCAVVGLLCFVSQITLFLLSPSPALAETSLSRPFAMSSRVNASLAIIVATLLLLWAIVVLFAPVYRPQTSDQDAEAHRTATAQLLTARLNGDQQEVERISAQWERVEEKRARKISRYPAFATFYSAALMPLITLWLIFVSLAHTAIGQLNPVSWRLTFFIPPSNVAITELDQVVGVAVGTATFAYSCLRAFDSHRPAPGPSSELELRPLPSIT